MKITFQKSSLMFYSVVKSGVILMIICGCFGCGNSINNKQQRLIQEKTSELEKSEEDERSEREGENQNNDKDYLLHFEEGQQAHNRGDYSEAINLFTKCVDSKPEFADGWGWRGLSKLKSGNSQGACGDWNKAVQLGASNYQNLINDNCN